MAAIPTWSLSEEGRQEEAKYWNDASYSNEETTELQSGIMPQQEDLYLQLSQVLQYEISHHKQTRAELYAEQHRREELENCVQQQAQTIARWQEACQSVYASLEGHRSQNANIQREMEAIATELARLKRVRIVVSLFLIAKWLGNFERSLRWRCGQLRYPGDGRGRFQKGALVRACRRRSRTERR
jgi:FtsZ-binding cell division protein ZapB